jgi:hypothetical protein
MALLGRTNLIIVLRDGKMQLDHWMCCTFLVWPELYISAPYYTVRIWHKFGDFPAKIPFIYTVYIYIYIWYIYGSGQPYAFWCEESTKYTFNCCTFCCKEVAGFSEQHFELRSNLSWAALSSSSCSEKWSKLMYLTSLWRSLPPSHDAKPKIVQELSGLSPCKY